jgi:hypothetical protein
MEVNIMKYIEYLLVVVLLSLTLNPNAQATRYTDSKSKVLHFDFIDQKACYDLLTSESFLREHRTDDDIEKGNYYVHIKDYNFKDGNMLWSAECWSNGSIHLDFRVDTDGWNMKQGISGFADEVSKAACFKYYSLFDEAASSEHWELAKSYVRAAQKIRYIRYSSDYETRRKYGNCHLDMDTYNATFRGH